MKTNINEASNGKLGGGDLKSIGGNHKLNPIAADAYLKMVDAAKKDGVSWSITDSYRSYEGQNRIFDWDYFNKTGKRRKKGTSGTPVAKPGTSNHGWGSAVDIGVKYGDRAWNWLSKNASKFGFSNPFKNPRTEPWHWEHIQSAKNMGATVTSGGMGSNTLTDIDSGEQDNGSGTTAGYDIVSTMLTAGLGLDKLPGITGLKEEVERIKKLLK